MLLTRMQGAQTVEAWSIGPRWRPPSLPVRAESSGLSWRRHLRHVMAEPSGPRWKPQTLPGEVEPTGLRWRRPSPPVEDASSGLRQRLPMHPAEVGSTGLSRKYPPLPGGDGLSGPRWRPLTRHEGASSTSLTCLSRTWTSCTCNPSKCSSPESPFPRNKRYTEQHESYSSFHRGSSCCRREVSRVLRKEYRG